MTPQLSTCTHCGVVIEEDQHSCTLQPQFSINELGELVSLIAGPPKPDILVENHGSIYLLRPISAVGRHWIDEHVYTEPWQWVGEALAAEPRLVPDLVYGARLEGLVVE